jgi:hypothetical protein
MTKTQKEQETDYMEEENMLYKLLLEGTEEDVHKVAKDIFDNAFECGKAQAISEFKEKLKSKIRTQQTFDTKDGRLVSMYDTLDIIEKTAQEIK